ncbi:MAG: hypothetical protein GY703_05360 [Gammaproteobacteria bacterium]|nr:hypothetical protein [Gammaproteobacteria bacterium]
MKPLLLLMLISTSLLADYPLEIIELKGRQVEEILPIIRPFIDADGSVAGMNNQLIIRTSEKNLNEIRQILARVDRPPRRLVVSVRQGVDTRTRGRDIGADVDVMVGKNSRIIVGNPTGEDSVTVHARTKSTRSDLDVTQRIRTLEGYPAFIATGQSVPIHTYQGYNPGPYPSRGIYTQYRDVTTGFYVTPSLSGNRVTLAISPHMDRPGRSGKTFDIQRADTVVSGRLGEWIGIGGIARTGGGDGQGIARSINTRNHQQRDIYVKVEEE